MQNGATLSKRIVSLISSRTTMSASKKKQKTLSFFFSPAAAGTPAVVNAPVASSPITKSPLKQKALDSDLAAAGVKKRRIVESDSEEDGPLPASKFIVETVKETLVQPLADKENSVSPNDPTASVKIEQVGAKVFETKVEAKKKSPKPAVAVSDKKKEIPKVLPKETGLFTSTSKSDGKPKSLAYYGLCQTFEKIEATTKRLEILKYLTEYYVQVIQESPMELVECVYLCLNRIGPEYEGKELGIGESILVKAVANATGRKTQTIKAEMAEKGDLGLVAQASKTNQKTMFKPQDLTVKFVFKSLKEISEITGTSSQQKKMDKINRIFVACRGSETKYLIRSLEGKLRIGLAEQTILVALAHATALSKPEAKKWIEEKRVKKLADAVTIVKQVYSEIPNYDKMIPILLEHEIDELPDHCKLTPGIPLKPMLAHPTKAISEVLDRFENMSFTCEYKYDGERAQIHLLENGTMMIYSRNSENLSEKYPDVTQRMPKAPKEGVTSFVLDCEAVAWDVEKKCILPFQVLSTRKRKDVSTSDIQVQVCIFAFDLIYLNGKPLTKEPLSKRRELLYESFNEIEGEFTFAKSIIGHSIDEIQTFLDDSIAGNCEGLMVKTLDQEASYEPSKRSRNWLKVKKDYLSGVGDSLDLVVIGGYTGRGKRTGGYGGYLLACYDPERDEYQSICKIGTGFSDEDLSSQALFFKDHIIDGPKAYYRFTDSPNIRPDVWFEPVQVWEVKCADLSISPVHQAASGIVDPNKGISLRFPRFIRLRDDKKPEQATSAEQVAQFYLSQSINHGKESKTDEETAKTNKTAEEEEFEY